jgi:hypothetical protein
MDRAIATFMEKVIAHCGEGSDAQNNLYCTKPSDWCKEMCDMIEDYQPYVGRWLQDETIVKQVQLERKRATYTYTLSMIPVRDNSHIQERVDEVESFVGIKWGNYYAKISCLSS